MAADLDKRPHETLPRGAVAAAVFLIGASLLLATITRLTDIGATRTPTAAVVTALELRFADRDDGAVVVTRAGDGKVIGTLEPGTNGFARGALRGLVRERRRAGIGAEPPFHLTRWSDGRLSLSDPSTGRSIELDVFGPTNVAAFARLLVAGAAR